MDAFWLAEAGPTSQPRCGRQHNKFVGTKIVPERLGLLYRHAGVLAHPALGLTSLDHPGRSVVCIHHQTHRGGYVWDGIIGRGGGTAAEDEWVSWGGEGREAEELWSFESNMNEGLGFLV